jgi:hypothetical protein
MHSFRLVTAAPDKAFDLLAVGQLIDEVMRPGNFYADPQWRLTWIAARSETIAWEVFRGRLLEAEQTRLSRTFLSWHVYQQDGPHHAPEPIISVMLDVREGRIHVARGFLAHVWEGHDEGNGVIESREVIRWSRELVGTIALDQFTDCENLRDELICVLWQAVVGTSRLPLASVEAPLPAFLLGQLYYHYRADAPDNPVDSWAALLMLGFQTEIARQEQVKLLEFIMRLVTPGELAQFADLLLSARSRGWAKGEIGDFWRQMFNDASLSPYTQFAENALTCIDELARRETISADERIDFLGRLLCQLGRHLTAYDLVTFHHRGANYPDALLVDAVLKRYLRAIELFPDRFLGDDAKARGRRRALRQGCLIRRYYEGHLVPDQPTSPGENARVMPASYPRVSDEQLLHARQRRRKLFAGDPVAGLLTAFVRLALGKSIADLKHPNERAELGLGLFIDRPLGYAKAPAEPDQTPILAHEALSPSIARRRWGELLRLCDEVGMPVDGTSLRAFFEQGPWPKGLPHQQLAECPRQAVALADVRKVANDFVIVRTKPRGLSKMLNQFELVEALQKRYRLRFLNEPQSVRLCVNELSEKETPLLVLYDEQVRRRVEFQVDATEGYVTRGGVENPKPGLRVLVVWEDTDEPGELREVATDVVVRRD